MIGPRSGRMALRRAHGPLSAAAIGGAAGYCQPGYEPHPGDRLNWLFIGETWQMSSVDVRYRPLVRDTVLSEQRFGAPESVCVFSQRDLFASVGGFPSSAPRTKAPHRPGGCSPWTRPCRRRRSRRGRQLSRSGGFISSLVWSGSSRGFSDGFLIPYNVGICMGDTGIEPVTSTV